MDGIGERQMDATFARELQSLKSNLTEQFQDGQWAELSKSLETLAKVGESQSCRELCLRAQSLRELMGYSAGGGRMSAGERASQLFHDLMFHLGHLQWVNQTVRMRR
jgi:hypothetical protein